MHRKLYRNGKKRCANFVQYPVQAKLTTSPDTVVPERTAELAVVEVSRSISVLVVRSFAPQYQPWAAVNANVRITVHVPVVPLLKVPAVAPPVCVPALHP